MLDRRAWSRAVRLLSWIGVVAAIVFSTRSASAYPWMIRHQYQGCVPCHSDPSGGTGLLTEYGRAMGENVLRTRYGSPPPDDLPRYARFAFGVPTPEWLLLGGSIRNGVWWQSDPQGGASNVKFLQMQADLKAEIHVKRFRASGSLGYNHSVDLSGPADLTTRADNNLVSRQHWIGVDLGEDSQFLLRAGRIDIPFGIRTNEHEAFVRSRFVTRTNINTGQQHGLALAYNGSAARFEVMAILGNYQLNPDVLRERGYAGYVEFNASQTATVGVSSMLTYARYDYVNPSLSHAIRQAHGVFTRVSPKEPLVIMAEVDAVVSTSDAPSTTVSGTSAGVVGYLQFDVEPTQGVHLIATGETWIQANSLLAGPTPTTVKSFSGTAAALWFFAPHCDVRLDFSAASFLNSKVGYFLLPQLHVYL